MAKELYLDVPTYAIIQSVGVAAEPKQDSSPRPELQYIHLTVTETDVTASALDGVRGASVRLPHNCEGVEPFTSLIPVGKPARNLTEITVRDKDGYSELRLFTANGFTEQTTAKSLKHFDLPRLFRDGDECDLKIKLDAKLLKELLTTIAAATTDKVNHSVTFSFKRDGTGIDRTAHIELRASNTAHKAEITALLCPLRP